jgi:hypothetical protein
MNAKRPQNLDYHLPDPPRSEARLVFRVLAGIMALVAFASLGISVYIAYSHPDSRYLSIGTALTSAGVLYTSGSVAMWGTWGWGVQLEERR